MMDRAATGDIATPYSVEGRRVLARALLPLIAFGVVLLVLWLSEGASTTDSGALAPLRAPGARPTFPVGRAVAMGNVLALEVLEDGALAVAAWPAANIAVDEFPLVHCDCVAGRFDADVRLIWRRADRPDTTFNARFELERGQPRVLDLSADPNWKGRITGIGIALRGSRGDTLQVRDLLARRNGPLDALRGLAHDWFAHRPWDGQSINLTLIGAEDRALSPVVVVAALVGLGLLATRRSDAQPRVKWMAALCLVVIAWLALDLRWQADLLAKLAASTRQYGTGNIASRWRAAPDADIYQLATAVKRRFNTPAQRVFVFGDDAYARGRAAYDLLPLSVHYDSVAGTFPDAKAMRPGDLVFLLATRRARLDEQAGRLYWQDSSVAVAPVAEQGAMRVVRVQ